MRDLLDSLRRLGVSVTEVQVRWAITSRKVSRPELDGSRRFNFTESHLRELAAYFKGRQKPGPRAGAAHAHGGEASTPVKGE
jgi:hypothetical protein